MRKLLVTLALTTALFAASTGYLAYQLYGRESAESADIAAAPTPAATAQDAEVEIPAARTDKPASVSTTPVAANPKIPGAGAPGGQPAAAREVDKNREVMLPFARQFLSRMADPVQHAALLSETRATLQRQYGPLNQRLKLEPSEFNQLLNVLAEQQLQAQEQYFRCLVDTGCDPNDSSRYRQTGDPDQELLALLGPDHMDDFKQYRDSIGQRDSVAQLRGRLNESNLLRDEQAEKLVVALADEQERYKREVGASGATLRGWGTPLGMLWYTGDGTSIEQQLSTAAAYSQRLQARASTLLTPQQLAVYTQMQQELLAAMGAYLRPAN